MGLPVAACPARDGGGGYDDNALDDDDEDFDGKENECDSSSWKWRVGRVEPLMILMPIEPSSDCV